MTNLNFDDYEPTADGLEPYEAYLSVYGLLCVRFGKEHGAEIYELLRRAALAASNDILETTTPGIVFNEEGGEFVGFERDAEEQEEEYFN